MSSTHRRPLALLAAIVTALALSACASSAGPVDPASTSTDPAELLRDTAVQTAAVQSGAFELETRGDDGERSRLTGVFARGDDAKAIPTFSAEGEASGDGKSVKGAARWVDGKGYVQWKGRWYVADGMFAGQIQAAYEQAQADAQSNGTPMLDPSKWLEDAKTDGTADVEGVETVKVVGTVDGAALAEDLERLRAQSGAMGGNGSAAGKREHLERELDGAAAEVYVGVQDRVTRKLVINGKDGDRLEFTLSKVGEDVSVDAPSGARPIVELIQQLHGRGAAGGEWTPYARIS